MPPQPQSSIGPAVQIGAQLLPMADPRLSQLAPLIVCTAAIWMGNWDTPDSVHSTAADPHRPAITSWSVCSSDRFWIRQLNFWLSTG